MGLKWTDSEEIALRLQELKPAQDPWALRFLEQIGRFSAKALSCQRMSSSGRAISPTA